MGHYWWDLGSSIVGDRDWSVRGNEERSRRRFGRMSMSESGGSINETRDLYV